VADITGYQGRILQETSKPDGTMRKLMDVSRLSEMGWTAAIPLEQGIRETYAWYLDHGDALREA
jgi:nucleoside-diphosphate-sugar epimerase